MSPHIWDKKLKTVGETASSLDEMEGDWGGLWVPHLLEKPTLGLLRDVGGSPNQPCEAGPSPTEQNGGDLFPLRLSSEASFSGQRRVRRDPKAGILSLKPRVQREEGRGQDQALLGKGVPWQPGLSNGVPEEKDVHLPSSRT